MYQREIVTLLLVSVLLSICVAQDPSDTAYTGVDPNSYNSFDNANGNDFDNIVDGSVYDYIVVGVGQAGSVICGRLAANKTFQVLGIEGGNRTHRSLNGTDYVAAKYDTSSTGEVTVNPRPYTRFDVPLYSQSIYTAPTPYSEYPIIMNGMPTRSWTAKILGGSGAHNGMTWTRFFEGTIDSWGVDGWSYNETLPYYKKSENASGTTEGAVNPSNHGFNGPIGFTNVPDNDPYYAPAFLFNQACINAGNPSNPDLNGRNPIGCGFKMHNIKKGVRSNGANEYLPKAVKQGNLRLALNAVATKVLFKTVLGVKVAYAVRYFQNGQNKTAYARKEVILSLGAVLTPKLLQLSGIGNSTLLAKYNIPVVFNNPNVGKNLALNQLDYGAWNYLPNVTIPNGWGVNTDATNYAYDQTGLWANNGNFAWAHLCKYPRTTPCKTPDYLIGGNGAQFTTPGQKSLFIDVETTQPKNRGKVEISSSDPFAAPNVNIDLVGVQEDVDNLVAGWKTLRKILKTYPATSIFAGELYPGPGVPDSGLEAYVKATTIVSAHWTGTARMGNIGDATAVLDPQLRVLGVKRLRVGDPSIYPSTNAGTSAQAVLAGERCACFILGC